MEKSMIDPASRLLQDSANSSHENYHHHHSNSFSYGDRVAKAIIYDTPFESELLTSINGVDVESPHLWPTSPQHNYRSMSPSSRTQAIARGQRELMEMVSNMPESYYELSLKDLVERPAIVEEKKEEEEKVHPRKKLQLKQNSMRRSEDGTGLLLKMVFPIPFRSTKTKKKKKKDGSNTKVSPRPSTVCENDKEKKEKEWWKKKSESGSGVESTGNLNSRSSKSSGSSSTRSRSSSTRSNARQGGRRGCLSFLYKKRGKSTE